MKLARFRRLAEAYGADLEHWPTSERPGARTLLFASAEAARILADARTLDQRLDEAAPEIDAARVDRVWEAIHRRTSSSPPLAPQPWMLRPARLTAAVYLTAMLTIGVIVGGAPSLTATPTIGSVVQSESYPQTYLVAWSE